MTWLPADFTHPAWVPVCYALLDDAETALLGCVCIDPPEKQGADAEISWWVVDAQAGTGSHGSS